MTQYFNLLDVFVNIDTNEATPDICNHDNGKKKDHTFLNTDMQVFNVEDAAVRAFKYRLNLPSLLIISFAASALQYKTRI